MLRTTGDIFIEPCKVLIDCNIDEFKSMVEDCHLTHLSQFAAFLSAKLRAAKSDSTLLQLLRSMDDVIYSGMPLPAEEEDWAYRNGIQIRVSQD